MHNQFIKWFLFSRVNVHRVCLMDVLDGILVIRYIQQFTIILLFSFESS